MRNRIIPEESKWSPYPVGVLASIPADVSFFDERETGKLYPGDPVINEIDAELTKRVRASMRARELSAFIAGSTPLLDDVLEIGIANTEAVRISEPLDYVELTIHDIPSDGIPLAIGADESTKPKTAPKASTPVSAFDRALDNYEKAKKLGDATQWGQARSEGMDW